MQLLTGFTFGVIVAIIACRAGSLNRSGAIAAAINGGLIFGLGGFRWAILLLAFFVSSSLLSKAFAGRKAAYNEKFSKGSQRDWGQVAANGGLGTLLAIVYAFYPGSEWLWIAFTGAMAAVTADTWATELGVFSPAPPRLITTGAVVERGASGGVSLTGSAAALVGAAFIGLCAIILDPRPAEGAAWIIATAAIVGGIGGSFFDSLLGATLQAIYFCPNCNKETERAPFHTCGALTQPLRGWRWLNNDLVNFSASLVGAFLAIAIWLS